MSPADQPLAFLRALFDRAVANPAAPLQAAADLARTQGCEVHVLGAAADARDLAALHAAGARAIAATLAVGARPILLVSGGASPGPTTAHAPNADYALSLARHLYGYDRVFALAAATSGADGTSGAAGAFVVPDTLARLAALASPPPDAPGLFAALGDQLISGPTLTDSGDLRALLILPPTGLAHA